MGAICLKTMANFESYSRFTLKCISQDVNPVSVKHKNIRRSRSNTTIRKAEQQLMNEHIRSISNAMQLCKHQRDTCINNLTSVLDEGTLKECTEMMERINETRHRKILERQRSNLNKKLFQNFVR